MDKMWVLLFVTSPFLAFFAWAAWWLITGTYRERKRALAAVHDRCEERRDVARSMDEAA